MYDNIMKHGHSRKGRRTRTYRIWAGLSHRRHYDSGPICDSWRGSFENFLRDMGACPSGRHTIDRIDNSLGYEPGNCRWATMKEQQNNRTNNRVVTLGAQSLTLQEWADRTGIGRETIARRLDKLRWSVEEALTRKPDFAPRAYKPPHNAVLFSLNGEKRTLAKWAELYGLSPGVVRQRVRRYGFTLEEALELTPRPR